MWKSCSPLDAPPTPARKVTRGPSSRRRASSSSYAYVVRVDVRETKRAGGLRRCRRFAEFVQALHDARLGVVAVVEQIEPGTQPEFLLAASRVRVRADVDIRAAERADAPNLARELERARERGSERPSERALRSERGGFTLVDDDVVVFVFVFGARRVFLVARRQDARIDGE